MLSIQFIEQRTPLLFAAGRNELCRFGREQVRNWFWRGWFDDGGLMNDRQKARGKISFVIVRQSAGIRNDDEGGEIFVQAAEAVRNPGPHARESRRDETS